MTTAKGDIPASAPSRLAAGSQADFLIYGHREACRVLVRRPYGTYDVERLRDGQCFRISGFPL